MLSLPAPPFTVPGLAPDRAAIEFILDVERKRNPAAAKLKAESFFDDTFIDELRKEGY